MKTRFCPSPTGFMHLGNARTALFSQLLAKSTDQGLFLLRIENTDKERSNERYTQALQDDLHWLELRWDEGPYWQSQRQADYDEYYKILLDQGAAYPCFCSESELAAARQQLIKRGKPPRYLGTCRDLSPEQIKAKEAEGLRPTLRFRVPEHRSISFTDFVKGEQKIASDTIGDFIIRRADGTAPFMYCNALDDSLMGITHVLRGEDHLANTPRQIILLQALDLRIPEYGHIALILGDDGTPLSKRNGSQSIKGLREQGFLALAINNYMARLGHAMPHDELLSLKQLATHFSTKALALSPARFDKSQLLHWQKRAVMSTDKDVFWEWVGKATHTLVFPDERDAFITLMRDNICFPQEAEHWATIFYNEEEIYATDNQTNEVLREAGAAFFKAAYAILENDPGINYKKWIEAIKSSTGKKGKALFLPLRLAMTGAQHGPELEAIFNLLARDKQHWVSLRLEQAITRLEK